MTRSSTNYLDRRPLVCQANLWLFGSGLIYARVILTAPREEKKWSSRRKDYYPLDCDDFLPKSPVLEASFSSTIDSGTAELRQYGFEILVIT